MRKEIKILGAIAIVIIVAAIIGANYYKKSEQVQQKTKQKDAKTALAANDPRLIGQNSPTLGAADAPVTVVEFFDPECESCRAFNPTIKKVLKDYDGKVRLIVRYMPNHANSMIAAQMLEAAGEQGKYWQMLDLLFQKQPEWGEKREPQNALLEKYATELGLDAGRMKDEIAQNKFTAKIEQDKKDGQSINATRTPTIFVNGRQLQALDERQLKFLIDEELGK